MNRMLPLAALVFAVSACSVKTGGNASSADAGNAADLTPEGPSMTAKLFGGGKAMPLEVQQQAANGTILYITSIQAKPTETVLGVKVVNGFERDVQLNWSDQKTFLTAAGQKFFLSPPLENKDVKVAGGATMQGELVFLGRLPQNAAVALVINDGLSNGQYTNTPNLSVPIPIAVDAFTDDGSKKN